MAEYRFEFGPTLAEVGRSWAKLGPFWGTFDRHPPNQAPWPNSPNFSQSWPDINQIRISLADVDPYWAGVDQLRPMFARNPPTSTDLFLFFCQNKT